MKILASVAVKTALREAHRSGEAGEESAAKVTALDWDKKIQCLLQNKISFAVRGAEVRPQSRNNHTANFTHSLGSFQSSGYA